MANIAMDDIAFTAPQLAGEIWLAAVIRRAFP
jgi:hypothetical protein